MISLQHVLLKVPFVGISHKIKTVKSLKTMFLHFKRQNEGNMGDSSHTNEILARTTGTKM